ncbi:MAG: hypothetical protein ACRDMY_10130, partial [Gaiellaceae bacterium]
ALASTARTKSLQIETGATGLEPATSGVTGHFRGRDVNDVGHAIALFMRVYGFFAWPGAWLSQAIFGRLLPVCCPEDSLRRFARGCGYELGGGAPCAVAS